MHLLILQVAGWLGIDVRLLTAFPTARTLAAQMRSMQAPKSGQTSKLPELLRSEAKLSRLTQDAHHRHSTTDTVPTKRPRLIRHEPNWDTNIADWTLTPPDPALGGAVLQSCGRVSIWPATVSSADVQSAASLPAGVPSGPSDAMSAQTTSPLSLADVGSQQNAGTHQRHSAEHNLSAHRPKSPSLADADSEQASSAQQQFSRAQASEAAFQQHLTGSTDGAAQETEDRVRAKRGREEASPAQAVAEREGRGTEAAGTAWRVKLRDCVDASPVILVQSALAATAETNSRAKSGSQQSGQLSLRFCLSTHVCRWCDSLSLRAVPQTSCN